jgi:membrane associated rhomboid family serine protease
MAIPFRDSVRTRQRPWLTYGIILLNLAVFLWEVQAGPDLAGWVDRFALVPAQFLSPSDWERTGGRPLLSLVTSTFLHGSWTHVIGNMLYLWVFGDNLEERLGRGRFLAFYLLCGALAGVAHSLANPTSTLPTVGASGAVAGVLGGYVLAFPRATVLTLIPLGFIVPAVRVPAWAYLGFWFLIQLASGLAPIWVSGLVQTVAFWAHVSGFLSGVALVRLLAPEGGGSRIGR